MKIILKRMEPSPGMPAMCLFFEDGTPLPVVNLRVETAVESFTTITVTLLVDGERVDIDA